MIKLILAPFAWRVVRQEGVYVYLENKVTGVRKARRWTSDGYSPMNEDWLRGGDWAWRLPPPPRYQT